MIVESKRGSTSTALKEVEWRRHDSIPGVVEKITRFDSPIGEVSPVIAIIIKKALHVGKWCRLSSIIIDVERQKRRAIASPGWGGNIATARIGWLNPAGNLGS